MRLKWYRKHDLTDKEIRENLPMHIWGIKAGLHIAPYYSEDGFETIDCQKFDEEISHIMPCPSEGPKKSRR